MHTPDFESFTAPDKIYYGTDFWMLNDRLDEDEIVRQLTDMKEHGVMSFIARTYVGIVSDYPGPDFKSKMRVIIDTARRLDMKLYLQAGYMPDDVAELPDEHKLCTLSVRRSDEAVPEGESVILRVDDYTVVKSRSTHALDIFSASATDAYLRLAYDDMWREFSDEFGKTVLSIWVDEPSIPGGVLPYPDGIEELFIEKYGYSLSENIMKLFVDLDGYKTVRYHYRDLLVELMENNYFGKLKAWCLEHGVLASGHLLFEETLEGQTERAVAVMPFYKYFDIPGVDVLSSQQNWRRRALKPISGEYRYRETVMATPVQCASAARQVGCEHVLCEMYGVTSEDMGFREQKHLFDYMAAHGINHRSIHGIFYSLRGRAKRLYPPHINYYQPYWEEMKLFGDYIASVSRFVSLGKHERRALVIHPLGSAYSEYTSSASAKITGEQPSRKALKKRDAAFARLVSTLTLSGAEYDLGDEQTIRDFGSVNGAVFTVGEMSYDTVVLPDLSVLKRSTYELLSLFAENGGSVIILGTAPTMLDGVEASGLFDEIKSVSYLHDASELYKKIMPHGYSLYTDNCSMDVIVSRRVFGDYAYYYLFNTDCSEGKKAHLTVNGRVMAEEWCALARTKKPLPYTSGGDKTVIDITLAEGGSTMIVTSPMCGEAALPKNKYEILTLPNKFTIEREEKNVLLLEFCAFRRGDGEYGDEYPILAVKDILEREDYSGDITLRYEFCADSEFDGLSLALEDADECTLILNGEPVTMRKIGYYVDRSFSVIALPRAKKGRNVLELSRSFTPLERSRRGVESLFETRLGTELESVYLLGDFTVSVNEEPERSGAVRFSRYGMTLSRECGKVAGELTGSGYPFYAGTVKLTCEFDYDGDADGTSISFDVLDASVCRVILNGCDLGAVISAPYTVDCKDALKKGRNVLVLRVFGTLRNLLGPYHRPDGERGYVKGTYGRADIGWMGASSFDDCLWYLDRSVDTPLWTDSYLQVPFGASGVKIIKKI